jgi:predicted DNA-binding transcriptional regulator AlpA
MGIATTVAPSKTVASIADVHVATVNRAVKVGELRRPVQISSRRVAHHMADVRAWLAKCAARWHSQPVVPRCTLNQPFLRESNTRRAV